MRRFETPAEASRTAVFARPGFLAAADIASVHALARRAAPEATRSRSHDDTRVVTYLSHRGAFRRELPDLYDRCRAVARDKYLSEGGGAADAFDLRVAEYHVVSPGGGLFDPQHVDAGSLVTVDVLLEDAFEGGAFRTLEADGRVASHDRVFQKKGDLVCFLSLKRHHVDRVVSGERRVLVLEFWAGPERTCPHRCERPHGSCDLVLETLAAGAGSFYETFFDALDLDAVKEAVAALADEDSEPLPLDRRRGVAA